MHGNVWEWCEDNIVGSPDRVHRGNCWDNRGSECGAAKRGTGAPTLRFMNLGFRLVRVKEQIR
jgi:formylglycine-generating enzyme required for sulfatase activity